MVGCRARSRANRSADRLAAATTAAPSSSVMVRSIPPNGHSTANSKGSGRGQRPQPQPEAAKAQLPAVHAAAARQPGQQRAGGGHRRLAPGAVAARSWWPWCRRSSARPAAAAWPAARRRHADRGSGRTPRSAGPTSRPRTGLPCLVTTSTSSMQPERKARIVGSRTTTFALRATVRSTASTAPVSCAGGPDQGGRSGYPAGAVSSPAGEARRTCPHGMPSECRDPPTISAELMTARIMADPDGLESVIRSLSVDPRWVS